MRILYFGTYRKDYNRNRISKESLRLHGIEVIECHERLWQGVEDRVQIASGGWKRPSFWLRVLRAYSRLVIRFFQVKDFDVMLLGYPGQFDIFLARLLAWLRRKPLVWDVLMSTYLIAVERGLDQRSPFTIQLMRRLEWIALRLPDRLIMDTGPYVQWFEHTHGIPPEKFRLVPLGADDRIFQLPDQLPEPAQPFTILYYGTFIPNHGVPHILEAARLLQDDPHLRFEFIGEGPDLPAIQAQADAYGLKNVSFISWLQPQDLITHALQAGICLGAFGTTPQSLMTVHNKIYEGMALARPVITGDSPAVRAQFTHGQHIYLCERANPGSLAQAIRTIYADPALRARLSEQGRAAFLSSYTVKHLGARYCSYLEEAAGKPGSAAKEAL
jgi:glycosyltransferase involved in cell wall biosynthesis